MNGPTSSSGRLEVFHDGIWGTVCDDGPDNSDHKNNNLANVVCRMLGYDSGNVKIDVEFGRGTGEIWMDGVSCSGYEASLFDCQHRGWGVHDCFHSEDVGVACSNNGKDYS